VPDFWQGRSTVMKEQRHHFTFSPEFLVTAPLTYIGSSLNRSHRRARVVGMAFHVEQVVVKNKE